MNPAENSDATGLFMLPVGVRMPVDPFFPGGSVIGGGRGGAVLFWTLLPASPLVGDSSVSMWWLSEFAISSPNDNPSPAVKLSLPADTDFSREGKVGDGRRGAIGDEVVVFDAHGEISVSRKLGEVPRGVSGAGMADRWRSARSAHDGSTALSSSSRGGRTGAFIGAVDD